MKLEDLLEALPSKEELANAIGLQTKSTSRVASTLGVFGVFGTGIMLGAGLALLFAPKAGQQIRHDLAEKASELGEHLRAQTTHATAPSTAAAPRT